MGPGILFLVACFIVRDGGGWLSPQSITFLAVLGGVILGRFLEFQGGDPRTGLGEPATAVHFRRWAVLVLSIGLAVWVVAHLLGNRST